MLRLRRSHSEEGDAPDTVRELALFALLAVQPLVVEQVLRLTGVGEGSSTPLVLSVLVGCLLLQLAVSGLSPGRGRLPRVLSAVVVNLLVLVGGRVPATGEGHLQEGWSQVKQSPGLSTLMLARGAAFASWMLMAWYWPRLFPGASLLALVVGATTLVLCARAVAARLEERVGSSPRTAQRVLRSSLAVYALATLILAVALSTLSGGRLSATAIPFLGCLFLVALVAKRLAQRAHRVSVEALVPEPSRRAAVHHLGTQAALGTGGLVILGTVILSVGFGTAAAFPSILLAVALAGSLLVGALLFAPADPGGPLIG